MSVTLSVAVGRFQTPKLHEGHKAIIDHCFLMASDTVIIFIGVTGMNPTSKDPLDFETRSMMIWEYITSKSYDHHHAVIIKPLKDMPFSDEEWVARMEADIEGLSENHQDVVLLIGGRDSFIPYYKQGGGKYLSLELPGIPSVSATDLRDSIEMPQKSGQRRAFREGIIHAHNSKPYPNIYPTVDVIIWKETVQNKGDYMILLGKKHGEKEWRMPGGFLDVTDESMAHGALREAHEECGHIELGAPEYITSCNVDDRRYKGVKDVVYTTVFAVKYVFGNPVAGDDLEEVKWFKESEILDGKVPLLKGHEQIILNYVRQHITMH